MAIVLINTDQNALVEAIKTDARASLKDGISIDSDANGVGNTPICTDLPLPVKDFDIMAPPGSDKDKNLQDSIRASLVPMVRHVGPFGFNLQNLSFSSPINFTTTPTNILNGGISVATRPTVARQVMAVASFSALSSVAGTVIEYWVEIDGIQQSSHLRFNFDGTGTRSVSGNWIISLSPLAASVSLRAFRVSGTGTITLSTQDSAALSLWG